MDLEDLPWPIFLIVLLILIIGVVLFFLILAYSIWLAFETLFFDGDITHKLLAAIFFAIIFSGGVYANKE